MLTVSSSSKALGPKLSSVSYAPRQACSGRERGHTYPTLAAPIFQPCFSFYHRTTFGPQSLSIERCSVLFYWGDMNRHLHASGRKPMPHQRRDSTPIHCNKLMSVWGFLAGAGVTQTQQQHRKVPPPARVGPHQSSIMELFLLSIFHLLSL